MLKELLVDKLVIFFWDPVVMNYINGGQIVTCESHAANPETEFETAMRVIVYAKNFPLFTPKERRGLGDNLQIRSFLWKMHPCNKKRVFLFRFNFF